MLRVFKIVCLSLGSLGFATLVVAGENNRVFVTQDSGTAGVGNTLSINQSQARNSLVLGQAEPSDPTNQLDIDTLALDAPAVQSGGNNSATVELSGSGGLVFFNQDSTGLLNALGNDALVSLTGNGAIVLEQIGQNNSASITVDGEDSTGILRQFGNNNEGSVNVRAPNASGELVQDGNDLNLTLEVLGAGSDVQFTVQGSNVGNPTGARNASVFTTAGSVTITQTVLP